MDILRPRMAFFYLLFLARLFQRGFVTILNQIKKPKKHDTKTEISYSIVIALFINAIAENMIKERVPKHAVIMSVSLKVICSSGLGLRKEKGHQIKSLSDNQL